MYKTDDVPFIQRYAVLGSRRFSNLAWGTVIFLGSVGFLITGISSYVKFNIFFLLSADNIVFFPQGMVMCFYGSLGFFFSWYLWLTAWWDVGGGFNEFNLKGGFVHIFRWGFPGKNRRIDLLYMIDTIDSIRVELKEGLNPRRIIYMRISQPETVQTQRDIPLTGISTPFTIEQIETQAYDLAKFLKVPLEMS
jgi:Ycf4